MMREIIFKYNNRGSYEAEQNTAFNDDSHLKIIVQPHEFSIAVGGEVLRSSSFCGCSAVVSNEGEVVFYDDRELILAKADKTDSRYKELRLVWEQDFLSILLGHTSIVDHYPNCDGEYDRYTNKWVTERPVTPDLRDNSIKAE